MSKKWYMLIWLLLVTAGVLASQENPFQQTGGVITLYFEVSSEELPEEEKGKLDAVGKYLEERPEEKIVVEGNAAPFDSEELRYNMGYERAENVKNYLLEQYQISENQIQVRSEGSKRSAGFVEGQDNDAYREDRTVRIYLPSEVVAGSWEEYQFALRANLLRWATLTPDIGAEWRINRDWGITAGVSWTGWKLQDFRYALWEVMPEVRYYLGKEKRGYIGVMFKAGEFNYRFSNPGVQGLILGGGISGGYQLPLTERLALDFHAALGYLWADCEEYELVGGKGVLKQRENRHWIGPVHAGISLVWKLF